MSLHEEKRGFSYSGVSMPTLFSLSVSSTAIRLLFVARSLGVPDGYLILFLDLVDPCSLITYSLFPHACCQFR